MKRKVCSFVRSLASALTIIVGIHIVLIWFNVTKYLTFGNQHNRNFSFCFNLNLTHQNKLENYCNLVGIENRDNKGIGEGWKDHISNPYYILEYVYSKESRIVS